MIRRRRLLAAGGATLMAGLARPAIAGPSKTLIFVPQDNLSELDPVATTNAPTRNFGMQVYETLFACDETLVPRPQMAEGALVEDDGLRWTIKLRDGLFFHDGEKVLARDCVTSIRRWMARDSMGQTLASRLDSFEATDDKTMVLRLKSPFPDVMYVLGNPSTIQPIILPHRLAVTDPYKQITEVVGSGPLRFNKSDYVSGHLAVFDRFDGYQPRNEKPSFHAGGKVVHVDRVEWHVIPDAATAANGLATGEVDWVETPLPDLLGFLRKNQQIVVEQVDAFGTYVLLRLNHMRGPTANIGIRQAILAAIDQTEVMQALMGTDPSTYHAPIGCFTVGAPAASDAGFDRLGPKGPDKVKAMLAAAGYNGEKVVLLHPTDQSYYRTVCDVIAVQLANAGLNVDDQAMDWGTVVRRRASKEPMDRGGWSMFPSQFAGLSMTTPLSTYPLRGNGEQAWVGWPTDPKFETLRESWINATEPSVRNDLARQIQVQSLTSLPYVPLGSYLPSTAHRANITGLIRSPFPLFWNVRKT